MNEVRRQFKLNPGIMEFKAKPDYKSCVALVRCRAPLPPQPRHPTHPPASLLPLHPCAPAALTVGLRAAGPGACSGWRVGVLVACVCL